MNKSTWAFSILGSLVIVVAIFIVFVFGFATTVLLSLRSPEVKVPDVMGRDRFEAERVLGDAGLNFRVRATRPSSQVKADIVLFQLPRGGEIVKAGQTVAMDISRPVMEGESSEVSAPETPPEGAAPNTNEGAAANENKPMRPKNDNKNANENTNTNAANRNANANAANRNANANEANRNANANRPATTNQNSNSGNTNRAINTNSDRPGINSNSNSAVNQNGSTRPAVARPSPTVRPN